MKKLLMVFIGICLLRRTPQDLPASFFLLLVTLLAGVALSLVQNLASGEQLIGSVLTGVAAMLFGLAVFWVILSWRERTSRFLQTATASFGADVVLGAVYFLPLSFVGVPKSAEELTLSNYLLVLSLLAWTALVNGHILRHSLDMAMENSLAIAIVLVLLTALVSAYVMEIFTVVS